MKRMDSLKKLSCAVLLAIAAACLVMLSKLAFAGQQPSLMGFLLVLVGVGALSAALIDLGLCRHLGRRQIRMSKYTEALMQRSGSPYRTLFESIPIGVGLVTQRGNVLACNRALLDLFGCRSSEYLLPINLAGACQNPQEWARLVDLLQKQGCIRDFETKLMREKDVTFHASLTVTWIDLAGTKCFLVMCQDITERKRFEETLLAARHELEIRASLDGLTGIANRRLFDERLETEWKRAARDGAFLSLIIADIDFFKAYNDEKGHLAGDHCLKMVARALDQSLKRPTDLIARYGGEEFAALLPDTASRGAMGLAESMRGRIRSLGIPRPDSEVGKLVTASFGIATMVPQPNSTPSALIEAADQALYEAKKDGRNCIRLSSVGEAIGSGSVFHEVVRT